jgi:PAS domain S-box-containing protein
MFDSPLVGVVRAGADGTLLSANVAAARLLGYDSAEELLSRPADAVWLDAGQYANLLSAAAQAGAGATCRLLMKRKDGAPAAVLAAGRLDPQHAGLEAIFLALPEPQDAEGALREWAEKYRMMVEQPRQAIIVVQDGLLKFANLAFEEWTGYSRREIASRPFLDLLDPHDRAAVSASYSMLLRDGTAPADLTLRVADRHGDAHWLESAATRILWDGRPAALAFMNDVTDRVRLEERLQAAYRLSQEINLLYDEDVIIRRSFEIAAEVLHFDLAACGLVQEDAGALEYRYVADAQGMRSLRLRMALESESDIGAAAVRRGRLINVPDAAQGPLSLSIAGQLAGSLLCAPMSVRQRVIGVLVVASSEPQRFSADDEQLLQILGDRVAVALENAGLYIQLQRRLAEMATLNKVSEAISATLDLQATLTVITDNVAVVTDAEAASVALRDEHGDALFAAASGEHAAKLLGRRLSAGQGVLGWVLEHNEPALVADVAQDPRFVGGFDVELGFTTRSIVCVPLQSKGRLIGVIEAVNKRRGTFDREDLALLTSLAGPAATSIENARLFEQVRLGRQRMQSLSRRLVDVQEAERNRIARELHDETSQSLTSLMLGLRLLEQSVQGNQPALEQAARLKQIANDALESLHNLAMDLRPAVLDHVGLVAAVRQYVESVSREHGLQVEFEAVGFDAGRLPAQTETALYRIVQEALTNVLRHARATRVSVLLERRGDRVVMVVEDNGVGFDPEAAAQSGRLGLLGVKERIEMLDGRMEIESAPGAGATLFVEVPCAYPHPDR